MPVTRLALAARIFGSGGSEFGSMGVPGAFFPTGLQRHHLAVVNVCGETALRCKETAPRAITNCVPSRRWHIKPLA